MAEAIDARNLPAPTAPSVDHADSIQAEAGETVEEVGHGLEAIRVGLAQDPEGNEVDILKHRKRQVRASCGARNDGDDGLACAGCSEHQRRRTTQRRNDRQPTPRLGQHIRHARTNIATRRRIPHLQGHSVSEELKHEAAYRRALVKRGVLDSVADQLGDHQTAVID